MLYYRLIGNNINKLSFCFFLVQLLVIFAAFIAFKWNGAKFLFWKMEKLEKKNVQGKIH
jgi:hypothetical protein